MGITRLAFGWSGSKKRIKKKRKYIFGKIQEKKCGFKMRSHLPRPLICRTHK